MLLLCMNGFVVICKFIPVVVSLSRFQKFFMLWHSGQVVNLFLSCINFAEDSVFLCILWHLASLHLIIYCVLNADAAAG